MQIPKLISDCFTGPDGKTWAIGRIYSLPTLAAGLSTPFVMLWRGQSIDLAALAVLFGGIGGAVMLMITGTNVTEPKASGEQPKTVD